MGERARVLLAEDDAALRPVIEGLLDESGFEVLVSCDGKEALARFQDALSSGRAPDAVLTDIRMPGLDGLELIERIRALDQEVPVVFVTAFSSLETAVQALRKGAFDYLTKPFMNDHLVQVVRNAVERRSLTRENRTLRREVRRAFGVKSIVSRSPGMAAVLRVIERAGPTEASLLVRGETGTGKELVARALHHASARASRPFVSINCAALPEGLLESTLFGHARGAFTGAVAASKGLFRAAHGGTLFFDEVGDMPPELQAKLLRVLETRQVRPVGAEQSHAVDVRIVSATHRDLLAEVEAERFREDLYYRLCVIEVEVPPLRDRPDDVPLLARHFLRELARQRKEPPRKLAAGTGDAFRRYRWPGNVRELKNAIEHAVTLGDDPLEVKDLPKRMRSALARTPAAPADVTVDLEDPTPGEATDGPPLTLAELERRHTQRVLAETGGDRRRAAELLGIDLSTLYRKLKRWREA